MTKVKDEVGLQVESDGEKDDEQGSTGASGKKFI